MSDIESIARMMHDLEDQLVVCMRCGMCQAVCPVFQQSGREADVARGKLALLDGLMQEMFADPQGVKERLERCLLCGSCAAGCPSGVKVIDIFIQARAIISGYQGLTPAKRLVLRGLLSRPDILDRVVEWGSRFQKLLTRPVNDIIGSSCARFASPLLQGRHFVPLASRAFHQQKPQGTIAKGKSEYKAAFFVGCLIDKVFPNVAHASIEVLQHHGVGISIPEEQGCCGIPALSSGDRETFDRLLRYNLRLFNEHDYDYLLTACATCTSTVKKIWPAMARADLAQSASAIAAKALDINAFLVNVLGVAAKTAGDGEVPIVTYHDSCHLKKSLGVFDEPRELIRANPAYRLKEMQQADACCGMGGSFNLHHYDISKTIGMLKREQIAASGCSLVATGCPACMLQLADMLSQAGDQVAIKHPVEIYHETLR